MSRRSPSRIGAAIAARASVLAPDWLRAMFWGVPMARRLVVTDAPVRRRQIATAVLTDPGLAPERPAKGARNVDLHVPEALFLKRTVTAPRSAKARLETLANLDLRQKTPFGPGDVFAQLGPAKAEGDRLDVLQWVIKRSDVEDWRRNLLRHGHRLRRLYVAGQAQPIADFTAQISPGGRRVRLVNGVLAVSTLAALLFGWLYPAWVAADQTRQIERDQAALRDEALTLRRDVEDQRARDSERAAFLDNVLRRALLVDTLRTLTVSLPDEVWLETVTYSPQRVTLNGQTAGSAAELVLSLGERPQFGNPRLSGPVSKTPANGERFEITLDLEGG